MSSTVTKTARRLAVSLAALGLAAVWAPPQVGAEPPTSVDFSVTFPDAEAGNPSLCAFDVLIEVQGKTKVLELPNGTTITTAPGQTATVTNLATGETLALKIPGSTQLNRATGVTVFLGPNLILRSPAFGDVVSGLLYAKGRFTFVPGAGLTGIGSSTDICALLA